MEKLAKVLIPNHLVDFLAICSNEKNDPQNVNGELTCQCGPNMFRVGFTGTLNKSLFGSRSISSSVDGHLALNATCSICGKQIMVFDSNLHGYDALFERKENQGIVLAASTASFKQYTCPKCSRDAFLLRLKISYLERSEYEELSHNGTLEYNEWADAFDWITISTTCANCRHTDKRFIDFETA